MDSQIVSDSPSQESHFPLKFTGLQEGSKNGDPRHFQQ
jgi:hypothetical protein